MNSLTQTAPSNQPGFILADNLCANIPVAVAAILPGLTAKILACLPNCVDQIILHGSATDEKLFRPYGSDIDLVILYSEPASPYSADGYSELRKYARSLSGPWTKIEITLIKRELIERFRNFDLCYEGRVCQGTILYDSNRPHAHPVLSQDEARQEVAEKYINRTWRWLSQDSPDSKFAPWSACRAACSAFHAILVMHDMDVSPKSFRWNLPALFAAAAKFHPELSKLKEQVEKLPVELAAIDPDDFMFSSYENEESDNARLMAASIRIAKACGKIAGCKPTYRSMRNGLRKLRIEMQDAKDNQP